MDGGTPLLFSATGPVPTPPLTLQTDLITLVAAEAPGYTAALPGSMIDDMVGTGTGILVTIDQARVDAVNNVTPYGANAYILAQQGQMLGVPSGTSANGSVYEVFTGTPGYVIPPGFMVGDGSNQYAIQDGGTVGSNGTSAPLFAVATNSGTFPIPAGSVTTIITSVPSPYTLTVTNPTDGVAATSAETTQQYRSRVLTAANVALSGTPAYLKTLLWAVPGVSTRLVAVRQSGIYWVVVCGGGDPYQVAGAIYQGVSTVGLVTGSTISSSRNITVSLFDAPDSYSVTFVNPPQQDVTAVITWNTTLPNFTSQSAVGQYISTAAQSYFNSIVVGQPINLLVLSEQIQTALAPILPAVNLTTLKFAVFINGVLTPPTSGTATIPSDPESYMYCSATGITVQQG